MDKSYKKVSFGNKLKSAPHSLNYLIFSRDTVLPTGDLFEESFILEGLLLGLNIKGNATLQINFKEVNLTPNSVLLLLPGQIIRVIDKSADFLIETLYISFDFIIDLPLPAQYETILNISNYPCLSVPEDTMQNLLEYYSFIIKQYNRKDQTLRDEIMKGLLYSLMLEFIRIYKVNRTDEKNVSSRKEELSNNFLKLLTEHYKTERNLAFYADKLCVTGKHLSSTVKEVTGKSALEWVHTVVIIAVKVLLKSSNKTVVEISDEFNFSNPSFFCRFFKSQTGISPLEYRNL